MQTNVTDCDQHRLDHQTSSITAVESAIDAAAPLHRSMTIRVLPAWCIPALQTINIPRP